MAKQYRDSFQWHASKKQLNRKGVPETMRMAFRNSCEREEALTFPISHGNQVYSEEGADNVF